MSYRESNRPLLSEEDFRQALARLNSFYGLGMGWNQTTARKSHVDEFGVEIESGEDYFKLERGGSSSVQKMSRRSMDKLLYMIVYTVVELEDAADQLLEAQRARFLAFKNR